MCARCWPTSPARRAMGRCAAATAARFSEQAFALQAAALYPPRNHTKAGGARRRKGAGRMERMRGGGMKWMQTLRALAAGLARNPGQLVSALGFGLCVAAGVWMWRAGLLSSRAALQEFLAPFGPWAAALFVAFQAVQVVVPVLPGGLGLPGGGCAVSGRFGASFTTIWAFAWGRSRRSALRAAAGGRFCTKCSRRRLWKKYDRWSTAHDRFARWFALLIFLPVAPDDYLCFLAGTTTMRWRTYIAIILLCKPFAIALYSLGLTLIAQRLLGLWA